LQIRESLIDNIGEDAIRRFLRSRGIEKKDLGQEFKYFVSNAVGIDIMEEEFEEFCYNHLMYGKRKLVRVFEIANKRKITDDELWLKALKKDFLWDSLNMCKILKTDVSSSDDWKVASVKTVDDKRGEVESICILFQCYIRVTKKISKDHEWCTYIPVEVDLKKNLLLIKAWRRQNVENEDEYKNNTLMNKIVEWLKKSIGIKVKNIQLGYKKILANMNESLTGELLGAIPSCGEVDLMKDFFSDVEEKIMNQIPFENSTQKDGKTTFSGRIMNIAQEMKNMVIRAVVSDYFFERNYNVIDQMNLSAVINSVKFSDLDNSITIIKSENNINPVFCAKPFLMLLTAMEDSDQVDTINISFRNRNRKFRIRYDATKEEYIEIGILDPEDYYLEDYEKIWEILKQYDYAKDKSAQGDCKAAIGE